MATNNNEFFDALAALEKERGLPAATRDGLTI